MGKREETCQACGLTHPVGLCFRQASPHGLQADNAPTSGRLRPGAMVGEYRVTGVLGEGGMGVVYEGLHPMLGRRVAIKLIRDDIVQSKDMAARFLQEARVAGGLRHRNIVDVFSCGRLPDGRYYQVMELLDGENLRSVLNRQAPLALPLVNVVIRGILSALSAAGKRGIVHRDLKPDNIFLSGDLAGPPHELEVKVLDFGLAKLTLVTGSLVRSRTGIPMGTPAYMSPEQCRAVGPMDIRMDIYSAGILLFEMLTGKVPFWADSAVEIMSHQITTPAPLPSSLAVVSPHFDAVVMRALNKEPGDRFQSPAEMLAAWDDAYFTVTGIEGSGVRTPVLGVGLASGAAAGATAAADRAAGKVGSHVRSSATLSPLPGTRKHRAASVNRSRRWLLLAGGLVTAGAAAVGGVYLLEEASGKPANQLAPAAAIPAPAAGPPPGALAAGYLGEAEDLLRRREMRAALEKLEQARALPLEEPQLRKRLERVEQQIESVLTYRQALRSLEAGDAALAVRLAKQSLDLDPQNAEAVELHIAAARALSSSEARAEEAKPRGWLTVNTTPPAAIFVDGQPVGRSPIHRLPLPPGKHKVELRLQGYQPVARNLRIQVDEEESITTALTVERHPADERLAQ